MSNSISFRISAQNNTITLHISPQSEEISKLLVELGADVNANADTIEASFVDSCDVSSIIEHLTRTRAAAEEVKQNNAPAIGEQAAAAPAAFYQFQGQTLRLAPSLAIRCFCVTPQSQDVVLALSDSTFQVWSSLTWQQIREFSIPTPTPTTPDAYPRHQVISMLALSDRQVLVGTSTQDTVLVDIQDGQVLSGFSGTVQTEDMLRLPDGRVVMTVKGYGNAGIRFWEFNGSSWAVQENNTILSRGEARRLALYDQYLLVQSTGAEYFGWDPCDAVQVWDLSVSPPAFHHMASSKVVNSRVGIRAHGLTIVPEHLSTLGKKSFMAFYELCASGETFLMQHAYGQGAPSTTTSMSLTQRRAAVVNAAESMTSWQVREYDRPEDYVLLPDGSLLLVYQSRISRAQITQENPLSEFWQTSWETENDWARLIVTLPPTNTLPLRILVRGFSGFIVLS